MNEFKGVDLKRAYLVPSSVFASPDEVVRTDRLSLAQKLAVLRRWEFDARRVAGFPGDSEQTNAAMLQRVQRALRKLGADALPGTRAIWRKETAAAPRLLAREPVVVDRRIEPSLLVRGRGALTER